MASVRGIENASGKSPDELDSSLSAIVHFTVPETAKCGGDIANLAIFRQGRSGMRFSFGCCQRGASIW